MQKIEAIVTPFTLETVMSALADMGVHGFTVTETKGCGHQKGHSEIHRSNDYLPKIKMEIVVAKEIAKSVVRTITKAAKTGRIGDGKIFVSPVESAVRIRTDERGATAL